MTTPGIGVDGEKPLRRGRYILGDPDGATRARVRSVVGLLLAIEAVIAPAALVLTGAFLIAILVVRMRRSLGLWAAGIGALWIVIIGWHQAVGDYLVGPTALGHFLLEIPGAAHRGGLGQPWHELVSILWPNWLTGQLPIAIVLGGLQAWWQAFLVWLHTDEWLVKSPRKGLLGLLRQRYVMLRIRRGLVATKDGSVLGVDDSSGAMLELKDVERRGHILVVGASGSGKTTTALRLARADIKRRRPVFATDLKGDRDVRNLLRRLAEKAEAPYVEITLDGGVWWDPFRVGSLEERRDMLVGSHDWTGSPAYYRDAAERFTQIVLKLLDITPHVQYESTLHELIRYINLKELFQRAIQVPASHPDRAELHAQCRALAADVAADKDALSGFRTKLAILANSSAGRWMRIPLDAALTERDGVRFANGHAVVDLAEFRRAGGVVVFSFNSSRDASMTARLGRLAIQSITATFGTMADNGERQRTLVLIDEFSALGSDVTHNLLARARGSGADVVLTTQTIEDLEIVADERAAIGRMLSSVATVLAHRIGDEEAATRVAAVAGTRKWVKERLSVRRHQGLVALQRGGTTGDDLVDIDELHPNVKPRQLQDLAPGRFVFIARTGEFGKRVIQQARTVEYDRPDELQPEHAALDAKEHSVGASTGPVSEELGDLDLTDLILDVASPGPTTVRSDSDAMTPPALPPDLEPGTVGAPALGPDGPGAPDVDVDERADIPIGLAAGAEELGTDGGLSSPSKSASLRRTAAAAKKAARPPEG